MAKKATYKDAGVDLDVYAESMRRLPTLLRRTWSPRVIDNTGAFAALFSLDYDRKLLKRNYRRPVLVACTDGVGTKLKIAVLMGKHDTVGIDLVAMSVNDCICNGAEPLFFLDYIASAEDDPELLEQLVTGISNGCTEAECALVGGETAVMPGFYGPGEYDMAGFAVGVVERRRIIDGRTVQPGDEVIGLASSGLHSNGYSLVRRIVFDIAKLDLADRPDELGGQSVGEALLEPTRLYVRPVQRVLSAYRVKKMVRALVHITGGGLPENLPRVLPQGTAVQIRKNAWPVPPIFGLLQKLGEVDEAEMYRVFNMGIGFAMVVTPVSVPPVLRRLKRAGVPAWRIGKVVRGKQTVRLI